MSSPYSSPLSSPVRKRQRLSSPTYDQQLGDLSQEDLDAYDALEAQLSQSREGFFQGSSQSMTPVSRDIPSVDYLHHRKNYLRVADDRDNPFATGSTIMKRTSNIITPNLSMPGLESESPVIERVSPSPPDIEHSSSPGESPNQDLDAWFRPTSTIPLAAFQTAATTLKTTKIPELVGFTKASSKGIIAPSDIALAKAQAKMNEIWQEPDVTYNSSATHPIIPKSQSENAFVSNTTPQLSPRRPALQAIENSPGTPTPTSVSHPTKPLSISTRSFISKNAKPFKSPLLSKNLTTTKTISTSSPLNPGKKSCNINIPMFSTSRSQDPVFVSSSTTPFSAASRIESTTFVAPARPLGTEILLESAPKRSTPVPFVTPFKASVNLRHPDSLPVKVPPKLLFPSGSKGGQSATEILDSKRKTMQRKQFFDLTPPLNRVTLASSGMAPQRYTHDELESFGINVAELLQITPTLAMYYSFHTPTTSPLSSRISATPIVLGPAAALEHLLNNGCTLATRPWVDNHWCLILWKLAGMIGLDPERESISKNKRWCWTEVIRQLFYRYEREINEGKRPALRLIASQDAPAAYPMVLCISNITWSDAGITEDGLPIEPHPELEVTDGWYRLRAQIDAPLARAVRRKIIRVGRKISIASARLSSDKKDPCEVLDAYSSTKLVISGNSSHLAPWHAKLGFTTGPCISTLHSLTSDGGLVAGMDVVIVKAYPVAFIEFFEDENGQKYREGPRNESEEAAVHEKWKRRWEFEMSKLHSELEAKWSRYEGYIDRLERRAGAQFRPSQDDFPSDIIENMYDELENQADATRLLVDLGPSEAGWLARHIRERVTRERSNAREELESELKDLCPPREVRSFRVLIIQDACTLRRPANRTAQLTVWDALNFASSFEIGQRFIVTNLVPTQQSAWMDCEPGSEVFLSTRRDSRWTAIKSRPCA